MNTLLKSRIEHSSLLNTMNIPRIFVKNKMVSFIKSPWDGMQSKNMLEDAQILDIGSI